MLLSHKRYLSEVNMITIGVMTGNSLDAVDAVMTKFDGDFIKDICDMSIPYSLELKNDMLNLREEIYKLNSDMKKACKLPLFNKALDEYMDLVIECVKKLIKKSGINENEIKAIGLHGQSIGEHNPPSVAGETEPFTTQVFNPIKLANAVGIEVVYDFRSDDIFNGGEGAPLAPIHNLHLSKSLKVQGKYPVAFINAGNTANIAIICDDENNQQKVMGFDCGPFNHYIDEYCRVVFKLDFDKNGKIGAKGEINKELLADLYNYSARTFDDRNFYDIVPPKSSGPHLYKMMDKILKHGLTKEDVLRTLEYFSAYSVFLSLRFVRNDFDFPKYILTFGGGWNNCLVNKDFQNLLKGKGLILDEHKKYSDDILKKIKKAKTKALPSDDIGISGQYMEARIMADLAYCYLNKRTFTMPEVTGCKQSVVCGINCYPFQNLNRTGRGIMYSRASKGWKK
jgi:anhydro-N-acetylmuramic acid kinase